MLQLGTATIQQVIGAHSNFKVTATDLVSSFANQNDPKKRPIQFQQAIPGFWKQDFPAIFQIPAEALSDEVLFEGMAAASKAAVDDIRAKIQKSRKRQREETAASGASDLGTSNSGGALEHSGRLRRTWLLTSWALRCTVPMLILGFLLGLHNQRGSVRVRCCEPSRKVLL